jgi:hypothetical protein
MSWLFLALHMWQSLRCGHAARPAIDETSALLLVAKNITPESDIKAGHRSPPPPPGPPPPTFQKMNYEHQAAKVRQEIIRDTSFQQAEAAKQELDTFGDEIAEEFGGRVSSAPIKSFERASEKVAEDYDDDWFRIKDLARLSIVLPDFSKVRTVVKRISSHFDVSNGYDRRPEVKEISEETDPLGYSGTTVFVSTKTMVRSEIQINSDAIIYAKVGKLSRAFLGDDVYSVIESTSGVPGGQGHLLYEVWRAPGTDDTTKHHVETVSKSYYAYFRKGKAYWGTGEGQASAAELIELLGDLQSLVWLEVTQSLKL